jgi:hypothetical protein
MYDIPRLLSNTPPRLSAMSRDTGQTHACRNARTLLPSIWAASFDVSLFSTTCSLQKSASHITSHVTSHVKSHVVQRNNVIIRTSVNHRGVPPEHEVGIRGIFIADGIKHTVVLGPEITDEHDNLGCEVCEVRRLYGLEDGTSRHLTVHRVRWLSWQLKESDTCDV